MRKQTRNLLASSSPAREASPLSVSSAHPTCLECEFSHDVSLKIADGEKNSFPFGKKTNRYKGAQDWNAWS
jgi:hypothetical protein